MKINCAREESNWQKQILTEIERSTAGDIDCSLVFLPSFANAIHLFFFCLMSKQFCSSLFLSDTRFSLLLRKFNLQFISFNLLLRFAYTLQTFPSTFFNQALPSIFSPSSPFKLFSLIFLRQRFSFKLYFSIISSSSLMNVFIKFSLQRFLIKLSLQGLLFKISLQRFLRVLPSKIFNQIHLQNFPSGSPFQLFHQVLPWMFSLSSLLKVFFIFSLQSFLIEFTNNFFLQALPSMPSLQALPSTFSLFSPFKAI